MTPDLPAAAADYVRDAIATMQAKGIRVEFAAEEGPGFAGQGRLGGHFDEENMVLFIGNVPSAALWLSVFVHEYMHFRQWSSKSDNWAPKLPGDCCPWYVLEAWLAGVVELSDAQRDAALRGILTCEIECEQMALAEVTGHPELGITPERYISEANVYLAYHGVVRMTRQWYQRSPYADESLTDIVPSDRLLTIDEAIRPTPAIAGAILSKVYEEVT